MKVKEGIRDMEDNELIKQLRRAAQRGVRPALLAKRRANWMTTAGVGRARRDLARALTVARERALRPSATDKIG